MTRIRKKIQLYDHIQLIEIPVKMNARDLSKYLLKSERHKQAMFTKLVNTCL